MTKELIANTTLSHYRIVSKIGEGGMGEVYLAQDTKLDRKVALKILPSDVAADRGRMNRFVQEAKSASALNHPNIITIYEIDETDAGHFIATEFIDGKTLRERMEKSPANLDQTLDVAVQIAGALAAAHAAGIVHRDVKPENVMVRHDGIVKVLDFGLAQAKTPVLPNTDNSSKTVPGTVMGSARYMSPEQARGLDVDERTDIWSLGVVLYEMLTQRAPFSGATRMDTMVSILEREPLPLAPLNGDSGLLTLLAIVNQTLRKETADRYQTAVDLLKDLILA